VVVGAMGADTVNPRMLTLRRDHHEVVLCPEIGGSIASFRSEIDGGLCRTASRRPTGRPARQPPSDPAAVDDVALIGAGGTVVGGEEQHRAGDIGRIELALEALDLE